MSRHLPRRIALTGSLASGKSTALAVFSQLGWRTFSADQAVSDLIMTSNDVARALRRLAPHILDQGLVDRTGLRIWVAQDQRNLRAMETIVHPLLRRELEQFLSLSMRRTAGRCVSEIPLLFEVGWVDAFDHVIVVDMLRALRIAHARRRPGVDATLLQRLIEAQSSAAVKRRLADRVVQSGLGRNALRRALRYALRPRRRRPTLGARHRRALGDKSI